MEYGTNIYGNTVDYWSSYSLYCSSKDRSHFSAEKVARKPSTRQQFEANRQEEHPFLWKEWCFVPAAAALAGGGNEPPVVPSHEFDHESIPSQLESGRYVHPYTCKWNEYDLQTGASCTEWLLGYDSSRRFHPSSFESCHEPSRVLHAGTGPSAQQHRQQQSVSFLQSLQRLASTTSRKNKLAYFSCVLFDLLFQGPKFILYLFASLFQGCMFVPQVLYRLLKRFFFVLHQTTSFQCEPLATMQLIAFVAKLGKCPLQLVDKKFLVVVVVAAAFVVIAALKTHNASFLE
eukprot:scaffold241_cov89-Cylindrotheca_fusiformis.AAC.4